MTVARSLLVFVCGLAVVVRGQNPCTTPDGTGGVCQNIHQCNYVLELIRKTQKVTSADLFEKLKKFECNRDAYNVHVCCPVQSEEPDTSSTEISSHRNFHFLPKNCGTYNSEDKVINGEKTELFEFPWMVLISFRTKLGLEFKCGGTIINGKYVLTAAHCITNLKSSITLAGVRVGEHDISTEKDCQVYEDVTICAEPVQDLPIEEIIPHVNFDPLTAANDIGLIRVKGSIKLTQENIKPVCLPISKAEHNTKLTTVTVAGWGRTESNRQSNVLMKVNLDIVKPDVCQKFYSQTREKVTHRQMCAAKNRMDSCDGDSGGPLMTFSTEAGQVKIVQYGIVSFGPKLCAQGKPAVYTDVRHYMDWILDNLRP